MKKKIIVIYGPPGVGKLTVAQELSKITSFKLFHVHQIADLLSFFFTPGTKPFTKTFEDLWFFLLEKILSFAKKGVIVTLVYGIQTLNGEKDDLFFLKIKNLALEKKADIFFIKLKCSDEEIKKRISSEERKKFKKITDYKKLKEIREKYNIDAKIPFDKNIEIDTTNLSPSHTAMEIKKSAF
jgi:broad-specificity NMP kinase